MGFAIGAIAGTIAAEQRRVITTITATTTGPATIMAGPITKAADYYYPPY